MSTQFFVDVKGAYIGGFGDGAKPPEGAVEVKSPPSDGRLIWDGTSWNAPAELQEQLVKEKRAQAYNAQRVTIDAMIVAIWERIMENRPEDSDAMELIRQEIKKEFPKDPFSLDQTPTT